MIIRVFLGFLLMISIWYSVTANRIDFFLATIALLWIFELFFKMRPNPSRAKKALWLNGHFCHRGLYTLDQSISENSLGAFQRSIEMGYGIELDVQLSHDGKVYVFHDDDLKRMTGVEGLLEEKTSDELDQMRLIGSGEKIPLLRDVLDLVKGQVPMLVELKSTFRREEAVSAVIELMKGYAGDYAYCSFDPLILRAIKVQAPSQLRGLNMEYSMDKKQFQLVTRVVLQFALLNFMITPDYLSVDYARVPLVYKFWRKTGSYGMKWAVPSQERENELTGSCETIIFEHYLPR